MKIIPENESLNFFLRHVKEMHETVKQKLNELFQALSSDNHEEKVKANKSLLEACTDLSKTLSKIDRPSWLAHLINETNTYSENHKTSGHNFRLLENIVSQRNQVIGHTWSFDKTSPENDFNFDHVFEICKKNSKLPRFFDALIDTLEKMISSGEIDSITALKGLEELIALIKQNKSGSYFSIMASWEFISVFTKNLLWQELGNLPGIKHLKSAFEKTLKDMDIEMEEMHKAIADEMKAKYKTTVHALTYKRMNDNLLEHKTDEKKNRTDT